MPNESLEMINENHNSWNDLEYRIQRYREINDFAQTI